MTVTALDRGTSGHFVRFVPPEQVYDKGADAVSKGIELQQGYTKPLTHSRDALCTEPKCLDASHRLLNDTGLALAQQCVVSRARITTDSYSARAQTVSLRYTHRSTN